MYKEDYSAKFKLFLIDLMSQLMGEHDRQSLVTAESSGYSREIPT